MKLPAAGLLPAVKLLYNMLKYRWHYCCAIPEHDDDDNDVPHDAPDHAQYVDTQVEAQLWHRGPGVCH